MTHTRALGTEATWRRLATTCVVALLTAIPVGAQVATSRPSPTLSATRTSAEVGPAALFPYRPGIDVQHYDLSLSLPERGKAIRGVAVITLDRRATVDSLVLDLLALTVDEVQVQGRARPFARDSATIRLRLVPADGPRLTVTVRYHGEPSDGLIIREDSTRGWSAFGDNWPNRARFWIPSVDHPSDKATVSWNITAPAARTVIANGVRLSRVAVPGAGNVVRTRYVMRQPIPTYLMVIAAARLFEAPLGKTACGSGIDGACVPQSAWTFADARDYMPGPFAAAGHMVQYFSSIGGSFPYEHLDHLQSATRFGGMENATAIFYSDEAFKRRALSEATVAHETAHQWFGDAVTPRRWQDLWLSEGFASYWAPLFEREAHGDSAFLATLGRMRDQIMAARVTSERPVVDTVGAGAPMTLLNENSYQKGGFALHMLHRQLGDSVFFRAIREYQQQFRHATATTDDLRAVLETTSGINLTDFFNQWLHRPGWADLTVRWQVDSVSHALSLDITQGTRFAPFALPLTVVLRDADGHEERVRVQVMAKLQQRLSAPIRMTSMPVSLTADPDVTVLGRIAITKEIP